MRIGFFTDSYLPSKHGVETSVESFRVCLEKMGHEVFVYAPSKPGYKDENKNVFRLKSMRVIKKPEMRFAFPIVHNGKLRELLNFKLDVAHAHTPFSLGVLGKIISKKQKIPMVYTHHTHYPEYTKIYLKEKFLSPYIAKKLTASFANAADAVVAPSKKVMDLLREHGTKKPIYIIPNGVDLNTFQKKPDFKTRASELKKKLGVGEADKILLFLGRLCGEKNIDFLIDSFGKLSREISNVKFVIAGDGPQMSQLKKLAKEKDVLDKTIFTGFLPEADKPTLYQMSNCFVFSSFTDMHPIVILEALASSLPIVALADGALENMLIDNQNGYAVEGASSQKFADKLLSLLKNTTLQKAFSNKSREIAQDFSDESEAKKLISLYEKLLNKHDDA